MDFDIIPYEDIVWGHRLGAGSFGSVYKGSYLGIDIAIKEVLPSTEYDVHKYFEREWRIMRECRHPNIVLFLGLSKAPDEDGRVFIISEFVPRGNLRQHILSSHPFPWRLRLSFATDVARAVAYLHARQCIHRDLKGENLLITSNERVKVTDFGFARIASRNAEEMRRMTYCGTDGYMSPEIINGHDFDLPTDVFSLGIIFIEIMSRRLVDSKTFTRQAPQFIPDPLEIRRGASPGCPPALIDLAISCCLEDPARRPRMPEVLHRLREIELEVLSRLDQGQGEHVGSIRLVHRSGKRAMPIFDLEPGKDREEEEEKRAEEEALRKLANVKLDVSGGGASKLDQEPVEEGEKWRTARWEEMPSLMSFATASSDLDGHKHLIPSGDTSSSLASAGAESAASTYSDDQAVPVRTASTLQTATPANVCSEGDEANASTMTVRGVAASPPATDTAEAILMNSAPPSACQNELDEAINGYIQQATTATNKKDSTIPPISEIETIPSIQNSVIAIPRKDQRDTPGQKGDAASGPAVAVEAVTGKQSAAGAAGALGTHRFTLVDKDSAPLINGKKVLSSGFTSTFAFAFLPRALAPSAGHNPQGGSSSGKCAVCSRRVGQRPGLQCDDCHLIVHVKCSHAAPRNCNGGEIAEA